MWLCWMRGVQTMCIATAIDGLFIGLDMWERSAVRGYAKANSVSGETDQNAPAIRNCVERSVELRRESDTLVWRGLLTRSFS